MNGGINQLVDTYKGNPQPLQAKVQKAQQNQPPGEIPPDLEEAMALQKIAELRNSAQGQQAMQAGGAQQSVVDKLRQMLGGMQQQAQMAPQIARPQQPVMAAGGGSIAQLMSNLGRHYAGGGIVAFNGKDQSKVPTEAELEAQRKADREKIDALARALGETGGEYAGKSIAALTDIAALIPRGLAGAVDTAVIRPARALGADIGYLSPELTPGNQSSDTMTPFYDRYIRAKEGAPADQTKLSAETKGPAVVATPPANIRSQLNAADAARFAEKPAPKPPAPPNPTAGKPNTGGLNVNAPAAPAKPAEEVMSPMETALQKSIMDALAKDPEAVRKKAMEQNAQFMGLDALLKPAQDRAAAREARIKEIQAERQPLWITALQNAGNKPGNIAQVLNQMATGVSTAKQGYNTQDLKFLDELNNLYADIDKAKIEGRYKDVAAGKEAVKDLIADRRQAEQSGTSLLNTKAVNKSREQTALDNRLSREAIAAQAAQTRRDAMKSQTDLQLERLKQGARAQEIKILQMGLTAQQPAIKEAVKAASTARMVYEAIKDRDPEQAAKALAKAEEAQHRIDMMLAPLSGLAGSSAAAASTGKPKTPTGGAEFLGFEPSKKS